MHTDSHMLTVIERISAALEDAASSLAQKYEARLHTPYLEENLGEIRRAIQASKPTRVKHAFEHQQPVVFVPMWPVARDEPLELGEPDDLTKFQAERAVIEAAKALRKAYNEGPGHVVVSQSGYVQRFSDLISAVEALEAAERGE